MKSIILSITALALSLTVSAQSNEPDYTHEIGVYGGVSAFTRPQNAAYTGERNVVPFAAAVNYHYNFTDHFQVGMDMTMSRWETQGDFLYPGLQGSNGFAQTTKFVLADRAWSLTARANYVVPMYDNYHINRSNFYVGVAAGAVFTNNDGRTYYGQNNAQPGAENKFIETYDYESGTGYTFGFQVGINYYLSNHIGLNLEAAPRYVHVDNVDHRLGSVNGSFSLYHFPALIGIRYRF